VGRPAILRPAFVLSRNAIEVLTRGRLLVEPDARSSHHGVAVEVPIEVVNALAESALEAPGGPEAPQACRLEPRSSLDRGIRAGGYPNRGTSGSGPGEMLSP
jgi:hypothetical protein